MHTTVPYLYNTVPTFPFIPSFRIVADTFLALSIIGGTAIFANLNKTKIIVKVQYKF